MEAEIAALRAEIATLRAQCPPGSIVIPPPDWQAEPRDVTRGAVSITMYDAPDGVGWTTAVYDVFVQGEADLLSGAQAKSWATLAEALGGVVVDHSPDAGKMVQE